MIIFFQLPSSVIKKFKIQSLILWQLNLFSITMYNEGKVVKTDVTRLFCVECHGDVQLDMFVMFVWTDTRKSLVTFKLPPL